MNVKYNVDGDINDTTDGFIDAPCRNFVVYTILLVYFIWISQSQFLIVIGFIKILHEH